jgi:HTH-type transcriptional regulator/antitoxin HigA
MQKLFDKTADMSVKPVKTENDYQAALAEIDAIFDAQPNTPDGDRLDVLTTLVEAYEAMRYPIPSPDPIEAIKYFLEARSLATEDLEPYIGSRSKVEEVLNRRRALTIDMIRRLHAGLGISADILIRPYHLIRNST